MRKICGVLSLVLLLVVALYTILEREISSVVGPADGTLTVVIDPGHGGMDGGAVSVHGDKESEINLEIALKTDGLLAFCGVPTVLLRQEDVSLHTDDTLSISGKKSQDLKQRVKLSNEMAQGVLLSIHQNTFPEGKYHGAQVFYSQTQGSGEWAKATQETLISLVDPENNRKSKVGSGIYLLEHLEIPGILVECGFLSNETEAESLKDSKYQRKLAIAMVGGLARWQQEEGTTDEV